jgi:hypothetical protein
MTASSTIHFSDLSEQKRFSTDLDGDLTVNHDVEHAIGHFLDQNGIQGHDLDWSAFSRGVRLDKRTRLADLPEADGKWTVIPTVSAGCR